MNLEELRKHIRKIISEEIYSDKGNGVNYEALKNEFLEAVKKNGRKIDNDGVPLRELEGSAIVSGTEHFFVFDYVVTSRKYEFEDGDGYYTPRFAVGGHFKFDITGTEVCDDDCNTICNFDGVANLIDGGYNLIKEWFDFDESVEFEDVYNESLLRETNGLHCVDLMLIEALNLGRIEKHGADGFVVLSANRSQIESDNKRNNLLPQYTDWLDKNGLSNSKSNRTDFLRQWNSKGDKSLLDDIRKKGYTYSMTYGGYHGTDNVSDSYEPSFVVYNHKRSGDVSDWDELFNFAIEMCGKYYQYSVYVQAPGEVPNYYDAKGNIVNSKSSKNMKFNRDNETYYTTTKRDKNNPQRFTADIVFEGKYYKPALNHEYVDRMRRTQYGEIFLG